MNTGRPGLAAAISPELVALALVVVVGGSLILAAMGGGGDRNGSDGNGATPTAATETPEPTPSGSPAVDQADISAAISVNDRLAASGAILGALLDAPTLDAPSLVTEIRTIAATARNGTAVADRLRRRGGSAEVAGSLAALYGDLLDAAAVALSTPLADTATLTATARRILVRLGDLPAMTAGLTALLAPTTAPTLGPPGTSPSPTVSPPSPSPSDGTPGSSPSPTASPSPTPPPGPGPNQLADAGFESGTGLPWELYLESSDAVATLTADTSTAEEGVTSARIEIAAGSSSRAGISLRQGGIALIPGERYVFRAALRAAAAREVGLRVVSTGGEAYGTRIFTVGTGWTIAAFEFTALVFDASAYWEIDLGRATATVWVDGAWFGEAGAPSGS